MSLEDLPTHILTELMSELLSTFQLKLQLGSYAQIKWKAGFNTSHSPLHLNGFGKSIKVSIECSNFLETLMEQYL